MKNKLVTLGIALTFLLLVSATTNVSPVHAVPNVGVNPGDLLKYKVNSFTFDTVAFEMSDKINYTGDLTGTTLWVKVLDVNNMLVEYWDPSSGSMVSGDDPIVDISTGIILAKSITLHTEAGDVVLPAGSGFMLPFLFGSVTRFNVSESNLPSSIIPIPVILNDDWNSHEATLSAVDGITVTQTSNEFIIDLNVNSDDSVKISGTLTYDKAVAGTLLSGSISITNTTTNDVYFNLNIERTSITNTKSTILVGDQGKLFFENADITYTATGDADNPDVHNVMNNITNMEGKDVLKMTVKDTSGLYYLASVETYNFDTEALESSGDYWFNAFGVIPFGPYNVHGDAEQVNSSYNAIPSDVSVIGLFTSPDFEIYSSLYQTLGSLSSDVIIDFLQFMANTNSDSNTTFASTTSDTPNITITSSIDDTATELLVSSTIDFDIVITDVYVETWSETVNNVQYNYSETCKDVTILKGHLSVSLSYLKEDPARFNYLKLTGNALVNNTYAENDTINDNGQIVFSNINLKLSASYDLVQRPTSATTTASTTSATTPQLALPGMTTSIAIFSLSLIALVVYKRRT